jgi:NAD(P)H-hydrate epimerase
MAAARHLANWGVEVSVVLAREAAALSPAAAHQLDVLNRMGVEVLAAPVPVDLVLDALIGYSLRGDPRGATADLIEWTAAQPAPVLALDTPSGLEATTGAPGSPCVSATATLTLAAPKTGLLRAPEAGDLYLADISVPPAVYRAFDMDMPVEVFGGGPLVRLVT